MNCATINQELSGLINRLYGNIFIKRLYCIYVTHPTFMSMIWGMDNIIIQFLFDNIWTSELGRHNLTRGRQEYQYFVTNIKVMDYSSLMKGYTAFA